MTGRTAAPGPLIGAVMAVCMLAGALIYYEPFLTRRTLPLAGIPAPVAMSSITPFAIEPHQQACMSSVTFDPRGRLAQFESLPPSRAATSARMDLQLVLSAPGYSARALVLGSRPYGTIAVPIAPPRRASIGTACFVNRSGAAVILSGSAEARTISRSVTTIGGQSRVGDIALSFFDDRPLSLLDRLGATFSHASNLTGHIVPTWLVWILAIALAFGVPGAMIAAFALALQADERANERT